MCGFLQQRARRCQKHASENSGGCGDHDDDEFARRSKHGENYLDGRVFTDDSRLFSLARAADGRQKNIKPNVHYMSRVVDRRTRIVGQNSPPLRHRRSAFGRLLYFFFYADPHGSVT